MKNKEYIINPSALSYLCNHCAYLKQNYDLQNQTISAGITSTLDGIEKNYFLGNSKKIDSNIDDPQYSRLEKNFSLVDGNFEKSHRIPENPEDSWLGGKIHHPASDADL